MCCVSRLTRRQAELAAQEIRESGVVPGSERMEPAEREDGEALWEEGNGFGGAGAEDMGKEGVWARGGGAVEGGCCDRVAWDLPVSSGY